MPATDENHLAAARMVARVETLPMLPTVLVRILSLPEDSDRLFDEVSELASVDPTFAVRVIHMANSAMSAPVAEIETVRGAVSRLGAKRAAALATSMAVARVFVPSSDSQRFLWLHALDAAVIARALAARMPAPRLDPERAYLAALLHDIGRFVLFDEAPEQLREVDEGTWETPDELVREEHRVIGFDHAELGALICEHLGLPETLSAVVRTHHSYHADDVAGASGDLPRLRALVQMADLIAVAARREHPGAQESAAERLARIAAHSVHRSWTQPPVPTAAVLPGLDALLEESELQATALGVMRRKR